MNTVFRIVVASELFFQSRMINVSRLKTPDGENVRSVGLIFSNDDVGTVLDETGNEHQNYTELF